MRNRYLNGDPCTLNNCDGCSPAMIQGIFCHETGCPEAWRDHQVECHECGCDFYRGERNQRICPDCFDDQTRISYDEE